MTFEEKLGPLCKVAQQEIIYRVKFLQKAFPKFYFQIHIQSSKKYLCLDEFTWSNIKISKIPYFIHETCQQSELLWIHKKLITFCDLINEIIRGEEKTE